MLLAGALGCGGNAESQRRLPDPAPAAPRGVPGAVPRAPAPVSVPALPSAEPAPTAAPESMRGEGDYGYFVKDQVENILIVYCGACHGPAAPAVGSAGIRFIDDVDQLVLAGLIVPLNSAASPIVRAIVLGNMPPPAVLFPMSDADLDTITWFIDNPREWPDVPLPAAADAGSGTSPADAGLDGG
ncbi:MAG TPA: hypothetical protein VJU61_20970 [Polyangiaceae bacterium]|nr:hypothetical protein [Polyangiaceae bacterium]